MARRKRRNRSENFDRGASGSTSLLVENLIEQDRPFRAFSRSSPSTTYALWSELEDRRTWHPDGDERDVKNFDGIPARVVERPRWARTGAPSRTRRGPVSPTNPRRVLFSAPPVRAFEAPGTVVVCARRKERREVLFAKRKTGKGAKSRHRRRSWSSEVSCSRS